MAWPITGAGTPWIAGTQRERVRALALWAEAGAERPGVRRLSAEEIHEMVDEPGDIVTALADAGPADKAEVYRQLGLRLTYQPEIKTVRAEVEPGKHRWGKGLCPRGGIERMFATFPRHVRIHVTDDSPNCVDDVKRVGGR